MRYILAIILSVWASSALAQAPTRLCYSSIIGDTNNCIPIDTAWPMPIGFVPNLSFTNLTASGTSGGVALPTGQSVLFQNTGTTAVSCTLGVTAPTAIANEIVIQPSSSFGIGVGNNKFAACIDQTGATSNVVALSGGTGLAVNTGGGGGGGGSGGAVTIADGADIALGTTTDTAWISGAGTAIGILKNIAGGIAGSIPDCGSNPCTNKAGIFFTAPNVAPTDCSGTIAAGGTAQNAFTAQSTLHGFTIANIDAATGSGEPICISFTGTATCGSVGTYPLSAPTATTFSGLSSYSSPPGFGMNTALSVVSATISHKYSCTRW